MSRNFDTNDWFLAGALVPGIGRSWMIVAHALTWDPVDDPTHMSAPSLAKAKWWLRMQHEGVPLHYDPQDSGVIFVYCLNKYTEQPMKYDEGTETWA